MIIWPIFKSVEVIHGFFTVYTGKGPDGKYGRNTKTITITDEALLKTKKRLQDYLDAEYSKFREEIESGEYITPQKMTFGTFVQEWRTKYATRHLEYKTLYAYESHIKNTYLASFRASEVGRYQATSYCGLS